MSLIYSKVMIIHANLIKLWPLVQERSRIDVYSKICIFILVS